MFGAVSNGIMEIAMPLLDRSTLEWQRAISHSVHVRWYCRGLIALTILIILYAAAETAVHIDNCLHGIRSQGCLVWRCW